MLESRDYYINKGDVLNVYREKRISRQIPQPLYIFIGTMTVTTAQPGSSVGEFEPDESALSKPIVRYKTPIKNDVVIPRLIIDSPVLFDPGKAVLRPNVAGEFQKVADFVQNFSPPSLIVEGHTGSEGDANANRKLSEARAGMVRDYLISTYDFITPTMVAAKGYGEERPLDADDAPEKRLLNERIEVVIWE